MGTLSVLSLFADNTAHRAFELVTAVDTQIEC